VSCVSALRQLDAKYLMIVLRVRLADKIPQENVVGGDDDDKCNTRPAYCVSINKIHGRRQQHHQSSPTMTWRAVVYAAALSRLPASAANDADADAGADAFYRWERRLILFTHAHKKDWTILLRAGAISGYAGRSGWKKTRLHPISHLSITCRTTSSSRRACF